MTNMEDFSPNEDLARRIKEFGKQLTTEQRNQFGALVEEYSMEVVKWAMQVMREKNAETLARNLRTLLS